MPKKSSTKKRNNKREVRVLLLGHDGAGKTHLLYRLKLGEEVTTIPTIGFNVEEVRIGPVSVTIWDVGGQPKIRPLWRHYFQSTSVVVFCVDSSNPSEFADCRQSLKDLLSEGELSDVGFAIIATKQDLPNALSSDEMEKKLDIDELRRFSNKPIPLFTTSKADSSGFNNAVLTALGRIASGSVIPPTAEEEEEARIYANKEQRMTWWQHDLVCQALGEETDTPSVIRGTHFSSGGDHRFLPLDVIDQIVSFLPLGDLVPTSLLHAGRFSPFHTSPSKTQGAWLVDRTFMFCAFRAATLLLQRSIADSTVAVRVDQISVEQVVSERLRSVWLLSVPEGLRAVHTTLLAAFASVAAMTNDGPLTHALRINGDVNFAASPVGRGIINGMMATFTNEVSDEPSEILVRITAFLGFRDQHSFPKGASNQVTTAYYETINRRLRASEDMQQRIFADEQVELCIQPILGSTRIPQAAFDCLRSGNYSTLTLGEVSASSRHETDLQALFPHDFLMETLAVIFGGTEEQTATSISYNLIKSQQFCALLVELCTVLEEGSSIGDVDAAASAVPTPIESLTEITVESEGVNTKDMLAGRVARWPGWKLTSTSGSEFTLKREEC